MKKIWYVPAKVIIFLLMLCGTAAASLVILELNMFVS